MGDVNHGDGPTILVTNRDERTFPMSVVQTLVRTIRGPLNRRDHKHENGSIKLDPPKAKIKPCTLEHRLVSDVHIYDVVPPKKPHEVLKKRIYYFAGGSWQDPPDGPHYELCSHMATELSDAVVSIVSMPLAPNNPASSSFPWCLRLYRALMAEAEEVGERVILAGDSSGANVILCLTLEALQEDAEAGIDLMEKPHPVALMVICPSTDLTRTNPDIEKIAPHDPLLTPKVIKGTAKAWYGDWDPKDRRVSPIFSNVSLLSRRGIKVHGLTAGYDVLSADGVVFRDKLADHGVHGEWVHWERQMHCFILTMSYGLSEAKDSVQWMIDLLNRE